MRPDREGTRLPAAVLWDMDGTLVDTEPYWITAEYELVGEHGGTWSDEHAHALVGNDLLVSAEYIARHGGVDLPPTEIVERLLDRVVAQARREVPWRPGARELLAELVERGVPCALVTMSWARLARAIVDVLPAGTFAAVVTGDEVRHGKPHPEPYLTAARRLGADPAACVAIEDSPTGVASATAAGVPTVAVPVVVPVPSGPSRVIVPTLEGVDPDRLVELARSARTRPDADELDDELDEPLRAS
jgi:HAD superfamily hydrolase (TIGR01509 family)